MATLYTIGHSTRTFEQLLAALQAHAIEQLFDIRSTPMSRRLPQFHRDSLSVALQQHDIAYRWLPALGGRRKRILPKDVSPNQALRSDSFRNYADYMLTPEFVDATHQLVQLAERTRAAYMCAERLWFRCHRMLVSDWLTAHGHTVLHVDDERPPKQHVLMGEARLQGDAVIYDRGATSALFSQQQVANL
ncbi:MAG: DUF488 domain-containing protein [Acidobacteriaceae bacterium]